MYKEKCQQLSFHPGTKTYLHVYTGFCGSIEGVASAVILHKVIATRFIWSTVKICSTCARIRKSTLFCALGSESIVEHYLN